MMNTNSVVYACSVSAPLLSILSSGDLPLTCLSRHDHACNFQSTNGPLIALVTTQHGNGPFHIVLPNRLPPILKDSSNIHAQWQCGQLFLGSLQISLQKAKIWQPDLPPLYHLSFNAFSLLCETFNQQPTSFLHSESAAIYGRARLGIDALQTGFTQRDHNKINAGARHLAGLGPGLTPAGDDFLVGFLAAIYACRLQMDKQLTMHGQLMAQTAAAHTTQLSAQWLSCAGQGHFGQAWHHLINALNSNIGTTITAAAHRILTTGATSGVDAMSGFLFGVNLLGDTRQETRDTRQGDTRQERHR